MKKSRLIIAFLSMGVALSAASLSFSYAWYASGTQLHVDDVNVEIDADRALTIATSIDGEYKTELNAAELNPTGFFTPVTTCFASEWTGQKEPTFYDMSNPMTDLHGTPYLKKADPNGFYTQEFFIQCDDDVYATIDPERTIAQCNETLNRTYAAKLAKDEGEYTEDEYFERLNGVKNCVRMSVLIDEQYVIYDPNPNEDEVLFGGTLDNDNDRFYDSYQDIDSLELYEVFYGEVEDRSKLVYHDASDTASTLVGEPTAFNAKHAAGVRSLDMEASKAYITREPRLLPSQFTPEEVPFQFELDRYTPKKLTVSIYLEGWDLDSVNGAMGSSFDLKLAFKIFRER